MIVIETRDALSVPKSNPPFSRVFVNKSPNVAPKGRVNIKAIQKRTIWFIRVN